MTTVTTSTLIHRVETAFAGVLATVLRTTQEVDVHADWSELGLDSIGMAELGIALNQEYDLGFSPTLLFERSSLHSLVMYLIDAHGPALAERFGDPAPIDRPTSGPPRRERRAARQPSAKRPRGRQTPVRATASPPGHEPIAIVGMSGRFPQARDLETFWVNLRDARDCVGEVPEERWDWRANDGDSAERATPTHRRWGAFIDGVDEFDPLFFGISPREAELMDPQQRLLLMYAWSVIEDAGYSPRALSGSRTAIFVGTGGAGYATVIARAQVPVEGYSAAGIIPSIGPNRMSYLLNLHGPSEPVETACSSSLVAIHRAVMAIHHDECEMAIAGGVSTMLTPDMHVCFTKAGMLSEDGRCKTFSAAANGYVRGEGVGMLFLKTLSAAERDGDHIYAVIRGSAENHGGRTNTLTTPSPTWQADVIKRAYTRAGIDPGTVTYVETHGTGTPLGDPIEINGLTSAFADLCPLEDAEGPPVAHCRLGSVKTNIGHLEYAAGIAGVVKVLLQLEHKTIVKSLHCEALNPLIQLEGSRFSIAGETAPWPEGRDSRGRRVPRRAGVSSFGFGGVNAHVVLEEYIEPERDVDFTIATPDRPVVILLSAKNTARLSDQVAQLLQALEGPDAREISLPDLAYTLQVGREAMDYRLATTVSSLDELRQTLARVIRGDDPIADVYRGVATRSDAIGMLGSDEELQHAIATWIGQGKYATLLKLWANGLSVDWARLHEHAPRRRVSLPTYPFARERYWVHERRVTPVGEKSAAPAASSLDATEKPRGISLSPLPAPVDTPDPPPQAAAEPPDIDGLLEAVYQGATDIERAARLLAQVTLE